MGARRLVLVVLALLLVLGCEDAAAGDRLAGFRRYATGPAGGAVWLASIPGATRGSMLYLPPGYSSRRRFPVVYLLAGMPGSPWSYVKSLRLAAVADELIASHAMRAFVAAIPVAGPSGRYAGEWAGPWEAYVVDDVVPWVDTHLATIAAPSGRTIAGLSAGGYGAVDIALRHPRIFGRVEAWGGYFRPFRDGPLRRATAAELAAHDPTLLVRRRAPLLRTLGVRFFLSTGPGHGDVRKRATTQFARLLGSLGLPYRLQLLGERKGMWERQLVAGLCWALSPPLTTRRPAAPSARSGCSRSA